MSWHDHDPEYYGWQKRVPLKEKYSTKAMENKNIKVTVTVQSETHTVSGQINADVIDTVKSLHGISPVDELYTQLHKELTEKMKELPDRSSEMTIIVTTMPAGIQIINGEKVPYSMMTYNCERFDNETTRDNAIKRLMSQQVHAGFNFCLLLDTENIAWEVPGSMNFVTRAKFFKV